MSAWHIITCEYPPQVGGVSDYCRLVAEGLEAAGDEVHVWCGSRGGTRDSGLGARDSTTGPRIPDPGSRVPDPESRVPDPGSRLHVHAELGDFTADDLVRVDRLLDAFPSPRRLLVQWVPHGYGYRSMNLGFCQWVLRRAKRGDLCDVMVHEPFLAFWEGSLRQTAAAVVHRVMTVTLLRAATRVFVSIPAWERKWRPYTFGRSVPFEWLPVPSTLPRPRCEAVRGVRECHAESGHHLVGHLGTYGAAIGHTLMESARTLLALSPRTTVLLMGRGSLDFHAQFAAANPLLALRVRSTGYLPPLELAESVAACDLLLQPYPDGVSTRRTSAMAGLALGVPIATNGGRLTEPLWADSSCVALADGSGSLAVTASRLLENRKELDRLAAVGKSIYGQRFDVTHTISALRRTDKATKTIATKATEATKVTKITEATKTTKITKVTRAD